MNSLMQSRKFLQIIKNFLKMIREILNNSGGGISLAIVLKKISLTLHGGFGCFGKRFPEIKKQKYLIIIIPVEFLIWLVFF
jgi:hypothetical protein